MKKKINFFFATFFIHLWFIQLYIQKITFSIDKKWELEKLNFKTLKKKKMGNNSSQNNKNIDIIFKTDNKQDLSPFEKLPKNILTVKRQL